MPGPSVVIGMTYEGRFSPTVKHLQRLGRVARFAMKRVLGRQVSILVEIRWRLGDEIMALPVYEGIKRAYPNSRLAVWCTYPELLEGNPYVDKALGPDDDPGHGPVDRYILLRGAPRTVVRIEHYARTARVPTPAARPQLYVADWSNLLLNEMGLRNGEFVAVSTGATWPTKRWPIERWRALATALHERGLRVVQLGRGDEAIGVGDSLMDRTTVRDAACVLRAARLFIGCDSGLMHLALAAGAPVVALFGPTSPSILVSGGANWSVITNERPCQGCWNDPCTPGLAERGVRRLGFARVLLGAALGERRGTGTVKEGVCPLDIPCCMDTVSVDAVLARAEAALRRGA